MLQAYNELEMCQQAQHQLLIINDSFGALACFSQTSTICWLSDSYISTQATKSNIRRNALTDLQINYGHAMASITSSPDVVLLKVPKTLAMLDYQLAKLTQVISSKTVIIAAGMCKSIHNSTLALFEKHLGSSPTSLAKKKARLILPTGDYPAAVSQLPSALCWQLPAFNYTICNHANLFSREKLDIGAAFFLQHLPQGNFDRIIDLGCGNGVIGLAAITKHPNAELTFVDESHMAVHTAKENIANNLPDQLSQCHFIQDNCLESINSEQYDLVLCNPPFHQQNSISDHIAWQMFNDAKKVLQTGGILRIIGNRHLGYHTKLKRIFGNCIQIAANNKFVILEAKK